MAHASKAFHLGFGKYASKSTLSDANNKRDYRIFEEFAYHIVAEARACRADDIFKLGGNVYAFDSTTIKLCLETFKWALFRKNQRKGGIDEENKREFIFFTNALDISPMMVATPYHQRWQIELFFKWLKQHLKIKKFWGNSENAVRIQIYAAIITYCLMAIVQKKLGIDRSITTPLRDLFGKPNCNIVNELDGSTEPTLF